MPALFRASICWGMWNILDAALVGGFCGMYTSCLIMGKSLPKNCIYVWFIYVD